MKSKQLIALCLSIIAAEVVACFSSAATSTLPAYQLPSDGQIIAFLLQSVDWYRHTNAERQIATAPADFLFLEDTQPIVVQVVRVSFDFAKADAALMPTPAHAPTENVTIAAGTSSSADLAHFIPLQRKSQDAIEKATQDVDILKKKAERARRKDRRQLQAVLEEAQSRLELLKAGSQRIHDMLEFLHASAGEAHTDLASTIDDLAQTVPEVNAPETALGKSITHSGDSRDTSQDSGILGLASDVSRLKTKLRMIDENSRLTEALASSSQNLCAPMAAFIRAAATGAISDADRGDLASLQQQKSHFDALTAELKSLSPAIVALDKQRTLLNVYRSHLANWHGTVAGQYRQAWKNLMVRVLIVIAIIAVVICLRIMVRPFVERHVHDANRRRFLGRAEWLLTVLVILVIAASAFASNLSSLVTYLGLLTAGIAVALQNVILASVGYLLLVGKRGIRVGDRVQISGVTGDVLDMGLLQFQLSEFDVDKQRYTGQIATFSNSLVFVSPATGLLKFDGKIASEHSSKGAMPDTKEQRSVCAARVHGA